MKHRVAFSTLGCRLNQYETDSVVTHFVHAGYEVVPFDEPADAYIINTCTVTARSDRKSRNLIYRARRTGTSPLIVVTGCYVENHPDLQQFLHGVDYTVGNDQKASIFPLVDARLSAPLGAPSSGQIPDISELPADRFGYSPGFEGLHTRGAIKIQDGCDRRCSYCIIPSVRGRAVSRDVGAIVHEISAMVDAGVHEMVLTGVNIGSYTFEGGGLGELIESIVDERERLAHSYRLRISSIEPYQFTDTFYAMLEHPAVCPHLHLCLQSGSDRILREMRRGYRISDFASIVSRIRSVRADFNLTTDIIVGFPGETDHEFGESLAAVEQFAFSHVHVFPFSARIGTPAADLPGSGGPHKERVRVLSEKAADQKRVYRTGLIGKKQTVLAETLQPDGGVRGFGEHYVPVSVLHGSNGANTLYQVEITGIEEGTDPDLIGEIVK